MDEKRRLLLFQGAAALWVASLGYPIYRYMHARPRDAAPPSPWLVLEGVGSTLQRGSAMAFEAGATLGILIHHADDTWVAFSGLCTHLSCPIQYRQEDARLVCPCHQGTFDAHTGTNLTGPPPRPLPEFGVALEGNDVRIDLRGASLGPGEDVRAAAVR